MANRHVNRCRYGCDPLQIKPLAARQQSGVSVIEAATFHAISCGKYRADAPMSGVEGVELTCDHKPDWQ
jgi:hypothetical protein